MNEIKLYLSSGVLDVFLASNDELKRILKEGYDVNKLSTTHGDTLLTLSVLNREIIKVNILLDYNPDISIQVYGSCYQTLFYNFLGWYYSERAVDIVLSLLDMDKNGDVLMLKDYFGQTAIEHTQDNLNQKLENLIRYNHKIKGEERVLSQSNIRFLDFFVKACENHLRKTSTLFNIMFKDVDLDNKKQRVY